MRIKKVLEELKDYKIEKKLRVSFGGILAMFLVTVVVFSAGLFYAEHQFNEFYEYAYELSKGTLDCRISVQGGVKSVAITLLTDDETSIERFLTDADTYMDRLGTKLEALRDMYRGDKTRVNETINALKEAEGYRKELEEKLLAGKKAEALDIYMNQYGPTMTTVQNNLNGMDENTDNIANTFYGNAKVMNVVILIIALIISILSLVATVLLSKRLITVMTEPVLELERKCVKDILM